MKKTQYDAEGLREEAATAIEDSPYTQTDVAEQLDVARTSVNRAVNTTTPKFEKLRQRIVEHLQGGRVEKCVTFVHVEGE
jgi:predicted XRE-type DNA-binding protein